MSNAAKSITLVTLAAFLGGCDSEESSTDDGVASGGTAGMSSGGIAGNGAAGPTGTSAAPGAGAVGGGGLGGASAAAGTGGAVGLGGNAGVAGGTAGAGGAPVVVDGAYYVSPSGSDSAPGTLSAPFRTVTKARDVVRTVNGSMSDDLHVYLRGGTYNLTSAVGFAPEDSGTNGHRIYYEAYPGETPILNGAVKITGWSPSSGGVYKAQLPRTTKLRNLYVDDSRAMMTKKAATARGGFGTYSVTAGQASWAWTSGTHDDGAKYGMTEIPDIAKNKDDLEIVNGSTWNENIVCVRDVVVTPDNYRALLFQEPYGAIAQLPQWNAGFSTSGSHTIYNAFEFLNGPGQFYFDKTTGTLYYYPRPGEDMATADVEAPVTETLIAIQGSSTTNRVKNLTFTGITFENTDYNLFAVGDSHGKATAQGATVYVAHGDGNFHNDKYRIIDTLPAVITVNSAESVVFYGNVVKHAGAEGISFVNDVVDSNIVGNYVADIAGSGIVVGHPQHLYVGDGGSHERFPPGVEGVCKNDSIDDNVLYDMDAMPGLGGHAGITAFFVDTLSITHNHLQGTTYNGVSLGWGWRNFPDSTTCRDNSINNNRLINTMSRLHDSGAIYTIGQMPGTNINQNYVKGIPPARGGPTYGLHNDEGTAYITEDDSVLDIDPGVTYTINCEDFGAKHDLTIRRTYATVNRMGVNPPNSIIDPPVVVSDAVWPLQQYETCLRSGVQDVHRGIIPASILSVQDYVFPASCSVAVGTSTIDIRSAGDPANTVWIAPPGTTNFAEGAAMTKVAGDQTSIAVPASAGTYKLFIVDSQGKKSGESAALLRVK